VFEQLNININYASLLLSREKPYMYKLKDQFATFILLLVFTVPLTK